MAGADDNARELCRREEKLFQKKRPLDSLNQELALNFYPERADFTTERALGEEFCADIFDSEPLRCRRDLGNARASMLRPRGQQWFKAGSVDPDLNERPEMARFLDALNKRARSLMYQPRAGFVRAAKEADQDIVTFGHSVQTVESTMNREGLRRLLVRCWHTRDCAWLDDADGTGQDFLARRMKKSARHIRKEFPDATLHASIEEALKKDPDQEFPLTHVMMLADEYDYYKKPAKKAAYVSVYYDSANKMLLRERPSERFRYVVDKWGTLSESQYGYSPAALTALSDGRGLQTMAMVLLEAGEKSLDPPLVATRDGVKGEVNNVAAGITWVDGKYDEKTGPAIWPLFPKGFQPIIGVELINRVTLALRDTWYLTKLALPQQAKTAYETAQLVEEFIRANIPLFEPWEAGTELLLDEIFAVLLDMGALGDLRQWPKELSGKDLEFSFANPLQDAIERNKVNQATQVLGLVAGAVKADPEAGAQKAVNLTKVVQDAVRGTGAPADWLNDEADVEDAAASEKQAQQILGALGVAGQAAEVVNTGAEAAERLQGVGLLPAADGTAAYGPV